MSDELNMEQENTEAEVEATAEGEDTTNTNDEGGGEEESEAAAAGAAEAEAEAETEEGAEEEASEEFKPEMKFKAAVFNEETRELEQKEHDIDARFAPIMVDEESSKLVRELHERAIGVESIRARYREAQENLQHEVEERTTLMTNIGNLRQIYQGAAQSGDWLQMDRFFQRLNIPVDHVLNYAIAHAELAKLDPAQRHAHMERVRMADQNAQVSRQTTVQDTELATLARQNKQLEIDIALGQADVAPMVAAYDKFVGRPGAFREQVQQTGSNAWNTGKKNLPAAEAVKLVIQNMNVKAMLPAAGAPAKGANANPAATPGSRTIVKKQVGKTIPNLQSKGGSPLKTKPKSIEDLKKIYNEKYA